LIKKIIDLGKHPLADSFLKRNQIKLEKKEKLECFINTKTKKIFLKSKFPANYRYNNVDYSYTSSNSRLSREHWENFQNVVEKKYKIKNKKILEIGSNDGYLLSKFQKNNNVLGIDSSATMVKIAKNNNIPSIKKVFDKETSVQIKKKYGKFDIIIANHVLNHADDDLSFLVGCINLLDKNSILIIEVPYWGYQVKNSFFDQIYHEHRNYFTISYFNYLQKKLDLKIIDLEMNNYHGKSIRIFMCKKKSKYKLSKKLEKFLLNESKLKLYDIKTYKTFTKNIETYKKIILTKLKKIANNSSTVVAIGASAKGNTFLNYMGLNSKIISAVTDSSLHKIGKYTPGSHIKIYGDSFFKNKEKIYAIILSWNFSKMLKKNVLKYNKNIKFLR
jgi:2-polyprenyl-3-methyl-5-hydroxy-6-metoxy-1,4-benzoquinol methylase